MLHLCYSNRFEVLCAPLAERLRQSQLRDPLEPAHIIVPNPTVEQFLRFDIAQTAGVAAHLNIKLMNTFLRDCVEESRANIRVVDKSELQLYLYHRIQDDAFLERNELGTISRYLDYAYAASSRQVRAFLLAGELARLFEEYSLSRRDILEFWATHPPKSNVQETQVSAWQHRLYRACFDSQKCLKGLGSKDDQLDFFSTSQDQQRHMMLIDAIHHLGDELKLPREVHLFGQSYAAPAFIEIYGRLSHLTELFVYALNPCIEFWEDIHKTGLAQLKLEAVQQLEARQAINLDEADPFRLTADADNPALRLWGRPGREYIHLLNELTQAEFVSGFLDPLSSTETLLAQLQHDILVRAPIPDETGSHLPIDDSIKISACPTLRREVEVVAKTIWHAVEESQKQPNPIRFHEIAILCPEGERDRYLAQIEDVFDAHDRIPVQFLDQSLAQKSAVFGLIEALLELPMTTLDHERMTRVLYHENLHGSSAAIRQTWRDWIDDLNVCYGADSDDLAGTYLTGDAYHWEQALLRILVGHFIGQVPTNRQDPIQWHDEIISPLESASEDRAVISMFASSIYDLMVDARRMGRSELTLTDWGRYICRLFNRYVMPLSAVDEMVLDRCIRCVERLADRQLDDKPLPYPIVRELLLIDLGRVESNRSQHRADGVVVSALLPMRTLPFRHLFVLGLGEGLYPGIEQPNPLDLRSLKRYPGDVSSSERDRYLFLETILATRECLHLSYVGQNPTTAESLDPSPVIRELEFVLRPYIGRDGLQRLTTVHPMTGWDATYFDPVDPNPTNMAYSEAAHALSKLPQGWTESPDALETYEGLIRGFKIIEPKHDAGYTFTPPDSVTMGTIRGFLMSPLQQSAKTVLRMQELESRPPITSEPITLDSLARYQLLTDVFWSYREDGTSLESHYQDAAKKLYLKNSYPTGPFATATMADDLKTLERWLSVVSDLTDNPRHEWTHRVFGPCDEAALIDHQYDSLDIHLSDQHKIKLQGRLEAYHPGDFTIISPVVSERLSDKHWLKGMVSILIMSAAGFNLPETVRVLLPCAGDAPSFKQTRVYRVPPQAYAIDWLKAVISDLCQGFHAYRLPIEVVYKWYRARLESPDAKPNLNANQDTSDRFGPIVNPNQFDLPPIELADEMVMRRFDLILRMEAN
ncbi:MAG: exodeoxyribonuclease V subunit gamma [Myxococcota bacterium]|nr:exodeoxyribonuclease V subunit gamma [Myxococcota bacterium]